MSYFVGHRHFSVDLQDINLSLCSTERGQASSRSPANSSGRATRSSLAATQLATGATQFRSVLRNGWTFVHPPAAGIQRRGSSWHVNFHMLSGLAQDAQVRQLQPPTRTSASSIEHGGIWRLPGRRQRMRRGHRCGSRVDLTNTLDTDPHVAIFGNLCITASMTGRQGTVTTRVPPLSTASSSARGT